MDRAAVAPEINTVAILEMAQNRDLARTWDEDQLVIIILNDVALVRQKHHQLGSAACVARTAGDITEFGHGLVF